MKLIYFDQIVAMYKVDINLLYRLMGVLVYEDERKNSNSATEEFSTGEELATEELV